MKFLTLKFSGEKKNVETKMLFSCLEIIDELKINFSPPKKKNYQSIN